MSKHTTITLPNPSGGALWTTTGNCAALQIEHTGLVGFYLQGTATTPSVKLQVSPDGTNWSDASGSGLTANPGVAVFNIAAQYVRAVGVSGTLTSVSMTLVYGGPHNV